MSMEKMQSEGEKMKKRICYDYHFMPTDPHNGFELNRERIVGLSLMVEFKIFVNGKEILYEGHDDEKEIFIYGSRKFYPANFVNCHYNPETVSYEFKENSELFQLTKSEGKKIKLEYKENSFSKDLKDKYYPVNITKEEFDTILKTGNFNNSNNKPAQNLCYCLIDATE